MSGAERPSVRSYVGMLILIVGLTLYAFAAAALGDLLIGWPILVQTLYYLVAGIVWIFPVKYLFGWIGKGKRG
ncbi:MAG: DUF2842 domain-containing protein [Alphaproteobacteria bacterium]|nr:MAG: DUF2842 domain-containing protein [Alphaproteobacteria bacterium]